MGHIGCPTRVAASSCYRFGCSRSPCGPVGVAGPEGCAECIFGRVAYLSVPGAPFGDAYRRWQVWTAAIQHLNRTSGDFQILECSGLYEVGDEQARRGAAETERDRLMRRLTAREALIKSSVLVLFPPGGDFFKRDCLTTGFGVLAGRFGSSPACLATRCSASAPWSGPCGDRSGS